MLDVPSAPESLFSYDLDAFVRDVEWLRSRTTSLPDLAEGVRERLATLIRNPNCLPPQFHEAAEDRYKQHIVYVAPDGGFSVVSLVWKPGQSTCIHDHVNWCVFGVYRGAEHETRYRLVRDDQGQEFLEEASSGINPAGDTSWLVPPGGDIHLVRNCSDEIAISIHVYGADIARLGTSISRRYDLPIIPRAA